ncbi:3-isopropylmalate/(R)-2-methylmalate dehydratase small subunit [Massilia sp. PDC64]|nr:3-isopropylmalate dehydratase small subunit [Massilia sp. PDC64]SDE78436.1 3-isopropylmalate/(R)-2-methylmalate dehydratase small subunit [Massilia sp. PDC64]
MERFITVHGPAAPFLRPNVDTDVIIRVERLTNIQDKKDLGRYAMETLRYLPDGSPDPEFVFNRPQFADAPIMLAGANFGCGSSREAAVWALRHMGVRCIVAPGFGDIFYNNCFLNGVLPVVLAAPDVAVLAGKAMGGGAFTVNLQTRQITHPDGAITGFEIDTRRRESLLSGLDDIELTLRADADIRQWQQRDRIARPWVWDPA